MLTLSPKIISWLCAALLSGCSIFGNTEEVELSADAGGSDDMSSDSDAAAADGGNPSCESAD